jgi:hypothetical protein
MAKVLTYSLGIPRLRDEGSSYTYEGVYVASGTITSGTPISLPSSETYVGNELIVELNGVGMEVTSDYDYVGSGNRTQISMTFDLVIGDRLKFRKEKQETI